MSHIAHDKCSEVLLFYKYHARCLTKKIYPKTEISGVSARGDQKVRMRRAMAGGHSLGDALPEEGPVHGDALQLVQRVGERGAEQQRLAFGRHRPQDGLQVRGEVGAAQLQQAVRLVQNLNFHDQTFCELSIQTWKSDKMLYLN